MTSRQSRLGGKSETGSRSAARGRRRATAGHIQRGCSYCLSRRHVSDNARAAIVIPLPIGEQSIVLSVPVSVCVCVHDHIFGTARPIFTSFYAVASPVNELSSTYTQSHVIYTVGQKSGAT